MKWGIAILSAALVFGAMDAVWLSWASPNLYEPNIGSLMAEELNIVAAAAFYVIYIAGMTWFAIRPGLEAHSIKTAIVNGALLGGLCYATFDLTSQAVFSTWATHITVLDICWGAFSTGKTSGLATAITLRFSDQSQ